MVIRVFLCGKCKGGLESRSFEVEYANISEADSAPVPECPKCGSNKKVSRFFGYNFFGAVKKYQDDDKQERYVPIEREHKRGIISIGIRVEENAPEEADNIVRKLMDADIVEKVESAPDEDIIAEKLDLKKGTLDRTLFDIRQKNMIEELNNGKKLSGFFMPLTGQSNN